MPYNTKQPRKPSPPVPKLSRHAEGEFGPGKKGLIICSDCGAVYFKKHWHHNLERLNNPEADSLAKKEAAVAFGRCPACTMIAQKQYEGRVTIVRVPEHHRAALEALIRGFCERAYDRDPMDRLIAIVAEGRDMVVTVTENQLANKLARKIKDEFHGAKLTHKFAAAPSKVAHVTVHLTHE